MRETQKELKELRAMQYEEKLQIITQKRLLHLLKLSEIKLDIDEEEQKKELIQKQKQKQIVDKMKKMLRVLAM